MRTAPVLASVRNVCLHWNTILLIYACTTALAGNSNIISKFTSKIVSIQTQTRIVYSMTLTLQSAV